jgi:hypothetical protein
MARRLTLTSSTAARATLATITAEGNCGTMHTTTQRLLPPLALVGILAAGLAGTARAQTNGVSERF